MKRRRLCSQRSKTRFPKRLSARNKFSRNYQYLLTPFRYSGPPSSSLALALAASLQSPRLAPRSYPRALASHPTSHPPTSSLSRAPATALLPLRCKLTAWQSGRPSFTADSSRAYFLHPFLPCFPSLSYPDDPGSLAGTLSRTYFASYFIFIRFPPPRSASARPALILPRQRARHSALFSFYRQQSWLMQYPPSSGNLFFFYFLAEYSNALPALVESQLVGEG